MGTVNFPPYKHGSEEYRWRYQLLSNPREGWQFFTYDNLPDGQVVAVYQKPDNSLVQLPCSRVRQRRAVSPWEDA